MSSPEHPRSGPLLRPGGLDRFYATRLRQLTRLSLEEDEAAELWRSVVQHRESLAAQLGRDVGMSVALMDFLANVREQPVNIAVIATDALHQLESSALVDRVTGLYNRAYFDAQLARECERYRRYRGNTALMLLDLDRFKSVNDTHGHLSGDNVLRGVSDIVKDCLRAADLPFRYGGDEIAALITDADPDEALGIAERVREGIAEGYQDAPTPVTASIGLAMLQSSADRRMELDVFERADRALYQAKSAGGNRVIEDLGASPFSE